jgi:hypothetical protein
MLRLGVPLHLGRWRDAMPKASALERDNALHSTGRTRSAADAATGDDLSRFAGRVADSEKTL